MIKNVVILALFLPLFNLAQNLNLTYDQSQNIKITEKYKNNTVIDSYTTKDDLTISIGDTLTIGFAVIKRNKYMFHDVFSHIVIGNTKVTTNKEFKHVPHNYSGRKVIVKSLFVTHKKSNSYKLWPKRKQTPLYVSVFVREYKGGISKIFSSSRLTVLDIEKALLSEEIFNYNILLSNDQKIKKSVDLEDVGKYDLLLKLGKLRKSGILTEEEFKEEKKKILESK